MSSVIVAIILWSSLGIVIRLSGMPVVALIFYPAFISAILTGLLLLIRGVKGGQGLRGFYILHYLPLGVLAPVSLINTFTFFYAYKYTTIANAVITHYTAPVIVALLAPLLLKERFTLNTLIAVIVATAGLGIMLDFSVGDFLIALSKRDANTMGILSGLLSGVAYAGVIIIIKILAINYEPVIMTFFQNSLIALILLPFMDFSSEINILSITIMGTVHSTLAPILYFYGMKRVTASRAGLIGYLEPPFSIILGVIFLKEMIDLKTLIGGGLVLLSGYITIKKIS